MKRFVLFLLLAAAGMLALHLAVGEEQPTRSNGKTTPNEGGGERKEPDRQGGIPVGHGKVQATVAQFGQFTHVGWRTVRDADGREHQVQQFELTAEDSKPVGETLQQLDRVEVKLFEDGVHVADVTAQRAFVEIGRDANGRPSLAENKDLDLRDVVLSTREGSKLAGLRLAIGDAKVAIGETEIKLETQETQPVLVVFEGERKTTLRGLGLRARLPRSPKNPAARGEIEILTDPVLESDGATVRARGRLHYLEDLAAGTATMTVRDEVQLDMERADLQMPGLGRGDASPGSPGRTTVRGDRFEGRLLRSKEATATGQVQQRVQWRRLDLFGAPATVDMQGGQLRTPQLTVLPGLFGETFQITAHGGASHLSTTVPGRRGQPAETLVADAERRIHLIQPMEQSGAMHRAMGFPAWTLRPIADSQIVVTEGRSHVEVGARKADASGGLRLLRQADREAGVVHGFGDVMLESPPDADKGEPLHLTGNDGFVLTSTEAAETLRLGPIAPDAVAPGAVPPPAFAAHHFRLRQGDTDLQGSGGCLVERRGERTDLWLLAPGASIVANVPADGLVLRSVHELRGALLGRTTADLRVVGWPVELVTERRGDTITARAPHVRQLGPSSLRLEPVPDDRPAALWSGLPDDARLPQLHGTGRTRDGDAYDVEVRGPRIDVHHAGGHAAVLDAEGAGTLLPTVTARLERPDQDQPTLVSCRAQRVRLLPHVLPPAVRQLHTGRKRSVLDDVGFASPGNPWLLLEQVADFQLDDPKEGHLDGTCERLLVSQGGRAALFVGNAEAMAPAVVRRVHSGRDITMEGARVRVLQGTDDQLLAMGSFADRDTFLPPKVTLHELGKNGLLSHMQATCHGSIEVRNDGVNFLGPVRSLGLKPEGDVDPEGLRIDARELRMTRNLRTGDVVKVLAKGVILDWPRMAARTAELEIDLERQRCLAKDPNGAEITVPGWPTFRSPEVDFHYPTMTLRAPRLRAVQDAPAPSLGGRDR